MKKSYLFGVFVLFLIVASMSAIIYWFMPISKEKFLTKYNLYSDYISVVENAKKDKFLSKDLPDFEKSVETIINSPFNIEYKIANLKDMFYQGHNILNTKNREFIPQMAIRYDYKGAIKYLEKNKDKSIKNTFQLMILYHIYKPRKVKTKEYIKLAEFSHQYIQEYFKQGKWQSLWRNEEYEDITKGNYLKCYTDTQCFLDILPYWMEGFYDVYIPCDVAQKYNKVVYYDGAGGGHGAQSFIISDCPLYSKYQYSEDLDEYTKMLFAEGLPYSDGSIRYVLYARKVYQYLTGRFSPKFDIIKQTNWIDFPYTKWATLSYSNFKKYNEVLNYGIGYKKALEELTKYYIKNYSITYEKAYNTALYELKIPSMEDWEIVSKDDLSYMLLSGAEFNAIQNIHKDMKNYQQYLHLSIAHPNNLRKLIELGQKEDVFDIDFPNWYGKTPLMVASQYGYLESVKILLDNKANINKQTNEGDCWDNSTYLCIYNGKRTALMYALQEGQFDVAKYLIENNADTNLKDDKNNLALDYMLGKAPYRATKSLSISGGEALNRLEYISPFNNEQQDILLKLLKIY